MNHIKYNEIKLLFIFISGFTLICRIKTNIAILRTDIIYAKDGHLATFDQVEGAHAVAVQPFPQSFKVLVPWRQVTALPGCIEISMATGVT